MQNVPQQVSIRSQVKNSPQDSESPQAAWQQQATSRSSAGQDVRIFKGGKAVYKTTQATSAAVRAVDIYKTSQKSFDALKTSQKGLYGLTATNGFSEAITGRDMFGNKVSKEQQEASMNAALGMLLPFGAKGFHGKMGIKGTGEIGWNMSKGGGEINGRSYSQHALERMAPDSPEVKATLTSRAIKKAEELGFKPQTKEFSDFIKKYVDPRNIPPSVIEDAIMNTKKIPGNRSGTFVHETLDVKVIINEAGDVITVIPK